MITDTIKEIFQSQQSEFDIPENAINRRLLDNVKIHPGFASIITGIRRCGKSTFLKEMMRKAKCTNYLNFEDLRLQKFELTDFEKLENIFGVKENLYYFDEIQNIKGWEKYVRYALDRKKKIVITGSNASMLSKELGTKLTGRHLNSELFPFSYKETLEYLGHTAGTESFRKYLLNGGFPEYLKYKTPDILRRLYEDILYRDIFIRHKIRNTGTIKELSSYLISNVGNLVTFAGLAKIFEIKSRKSVITYQSYFEDSYFLFTVPKFDFSIRKQLVNPKKIYCIDTGLIQANTLSFTEDYGRLLENAVFIKLRDSDYKIYYYKNKRECDFVVRIFNKIVNAYQVCYEVNNENETREIEGLYEALDFFKLKSGVIITFAQEDKLTYKGKTIKLIPGYKWFSK